MRCIAFFIYILFIDHSQSSSTFSSKLLWKLAEHATDAREKSRARREADVQFGKEYLLTYGYMAPGSLSSDSGTSAQQSWSKALAEMQSFLGLEPTGSFDEATVELMRKPRCANSDKTSMQVNFKRKKRYVTVGSKWMKRSITYAIENYTPKLGEQLTHEAIDAAFKAWSKHAPLDFIKIKPDANADIKILFAEGAHNDNTAFDGVGGYLAHAYYPGSGIGGDTHFDGAEPWTLHKEAYNGNDLFLVAVHELGHALGLGHSQVSDAIMAPIYKYHNTQTFELPQDDIFGIQRIYGARDKVPEKPLVPTTEKRTTTVPTTTTKKINPYNTRRPRPPVTRAPTTRYTTTTTESPPPELCKLKKYDAVSFLRGELYVFSGQYMWRQRRGHKKLIGPTKISALWPAVGKGVDAVYENPDTNRIVFFQGHMYWMYKGTKLVGNHPRHVRYLGFQNDHIDAAVWWDRNGKTYFFKDEHYWRFSSGRIERDYPKVIKKVWTGVPTHVDAAFAGIGEAGKNFTYFLKGTNYYTFNNWNIKVVKGARSFRDDWLGCGEVYGDDDDDKTKSKAVEPHVVTPLPAIIAVTVVAVVVLALILVVLWRRRQQNVKHGVVTSIATSNYTAGYSNKLAESERSEKPLCVQQRIRRIQYMLQEKV